MFFNTSELDDCLLDSLESSVRFFSEEDLACIKRNELQFNFPTLKYFTLCLWNWYYKLICSWAAHVQKNCLPFILVSPLLYLWNVCKWDVVITTFFTRLLFFTRFVSVSSDDACETKSFSHSILWLPLPVSSCGKKLLCSQIYFSFLLVEIDISIMQELLNRYLLYPYLISWPKSDMITTPAIPSFHTPDTYSSPILVRA